MLFLYRIGIALFGLLMRLAALWHPKARLWVLGRKGLLAHIAAELPDGKPSAWFHFASLGEFEQGRPVLEGLRKRRPDLQLIVTFFSPSGYEIRKNYAGADHVFYLPEDNPSNAVEFIRLIKPELAIFTKYEYWYFFFRELHRQSIPLYLISSIFRPDQVFFKWYGSLHRRMLGFVKHFFVQNEESKTLLAQLGHQNITVAGDTRFDRVMELSKHPKKIKEVADFCWDAPVLVAGSTWPEDEVLLAELLQKYPDWKLIIAPHEVDEAHIQELMKRFPEGQAIRYSELVSQNSKVNNPATRNLQPSTLIVDTIGLLSSLYAYGDVAYIGGGFGKGIHNTLEAVAYGIPVVFGPKYEKFQEAKDLIQEKAGFSIANAASLGQVFSNLQEEIQRKAAGRAAGNYVQSRVGATKLILQHILSY
jgi:3-deoxy-D-manno-octulosonic-acid transferase